MGDDLLIEVLNEFIESGEGRLVLALVLAESFSESSEESFNEFDDLVDGGDVEFIGGSEFHQDIDDGLDEGVMGFFSTLLEQGLNFLEFLGELNEHNSVLDERDGRGRSGSGDFSQQSDSLLAGSDGLIEVSLVVGEN